MIAALLTLTLSAAGCTSGTQGSGDPGDAKVRIGVSMYAEDNFSAQGKEGMEAYAKARNIDLVWNSADFDVTKQANQIDQYVNAKMDGILIAAVQYDSLAPQLAAAKAAGVKIGIVNANVKDDSSVDTVVVPDNVAAGAQNAQMMMDYLGGKGNVAILQCQLGAAFEVDRTKGMEQVIAKYPDVKVVAKGPGHTRTEAVDRVKNWLQANPDIDGVVACGDDGALGALQAASEKGKSFAIVGVDGVQDGLDAVRDGRFLGTQMQHARTEYAVALGALYHFIKGDMTFEKHQYYIMKPVTKENVDNFYPNVVSDVSSFLKRLPDVVDKNLKSGDLANED